MTEKTVRVANSLDTRNAALFVQAVGKYQSSVKLHSDNKTINAKSIMGVIAMSLMEGDEVTVTAEGGDEALALEALCKFLAG